MQCDTLAKKVVERATVFPNDAEPLALAQLREIDSAESNPCSKKDGSFTERAMLDFLESTGYGRGGIRADPCLTNFLFGLINTDSGRRVARVVLVQPRRRHHGEEERSGSEVRYRD